MRKKIFYLLLFFISTAIGQNYPNQWKKVVALENEGKIKSANLIVDKIYKKAFANHNETQEIKCFFYKSKYMQTLEEDAQSDILTRLQTDIEHMSVPSKSILYAVYGKCLSDYLNKHSYAIYRNTKVNSSQTQNFSTWSHADFEVQIAMAYERSIENEAVLKKTKLEPYEPIFDFLSLEKFKNQYLLEYLLKENINHYGAKAHYLDIRSEKSKELQPLCFGSSTDFIAAPLDWIDDKVLKKILQLYQRLESSYPSIENRLDRILFCTKIFPSGAYDLLSVLNQIQKQATDTLTTQKIQLEKAAIYAYQANKQKHPDYNVKALEILDSILKIKNRSNAYFAALTKRNQIASKFLQVEIQQYSYPKENLRAYMIYKNVDQVTLTFFKIDQKTVAAFKNSKIDQDSLLTAIVKKNNTFESINHRFTNKHDHFEYSTEIKLPEFETGSYLVYYESDAYDQTLKANNYNVMTVSNFTMLANVIANETRLQVLDRKTGKPIENAAIQYNNSIFLNTDRDGIATDKKIWTNYGVKEIRITKANDTIQLAENYLNQRDKRSAADSIFNAKTFFYLDRGIYRPGQTVYYKGITIQNKENVISVVPNAKQKIVVEDDESNTIKEFEATTNEFGSFSGEFVIPKNVLTGNFSIQADEPDDTENDPLYDKKKDEHPFWDNVEFLYSRETFKVEEYKRPKFEVTFDPVKQSYTLNQPISISGMARAFSDNPIADAKITYTIKRSTYDSYHSYYPENTQDLTGGETKTDAEGKFTIGFTTIPSENAQKEKLPVFDYKIDVDVTDTNGETHAAQMTVKVGYHSLQLDAAIPNVVETKNNAEIKLSSTNLNHEFVATKGELKIYFIKDYQNKFKERTWPIPEVQSISEADFTRWFPHETYKETPYTETLAYSKAIDTQKDKTVPLNFIANYKPGYYRLVFSAVDPFGNTIEEAKLFQIHQADSANDPAALFTIKQVNEDVKKDGFVILKITSVTPDLYVIATANYSGKAFFEKNIALKNNEATIKVPIENGFIGNVKIGFESIFDNQRFDKEFQVDLKPETSKMSFEVESFRNKIEPGSKESWSFRLLTDKHQESEILASMYDSSLDQFSKSYWDQLNINETPYNYIQQSTLLGIAKLESVIRNLNPHLQRAEYRNENTQLIWFGFDFNNFNTYHNQKLYKEQITKKSLKPLNAKMVSGIVTDNANLPLPGVNVIVKGTIRGIQTDFDGYYQIEAAVGEELVFSFIGMKDKTVRVLSNAIDIALDDSGDELSEVVVTSQGISKEKRSLGYAVSTVESDDTGSDNALQYLTGKVPGVAVTSGLAGSGTSIIIRGYSSVQGSSQALVVIDGNVSSAQELEKISSADIVSIDILKGLSATTLYGSQGANGVIVVTTKKAIKELTQVKARSNLSETAFFYPHLKTDAKGNVQFSFTAPEALTQWRMRLMAHDKKATSGYIEKMVVTQKDFMVVPNLPRFFREKDTIILRTKITNVTKETKSGVAVLQLYNAETMQPIDAQTLNANPVKNFNVAAFGNATVLWKIYIPEGLQSIQCKVLAKSGSFSDGEESILPVLTNNILVTETLPVWVRENSQKKYTLENLKNITSPTLRHHQLVLEYTSNPAWMAIQSLPYLMEYEHECAEQTFARLYANALASEIISSNPKIAAVFATWKEKGKSEVALEKNEALKAIMLAETPWADDALSEEDQKKNMALLFDLEKMKASQESTFEKLRQKQKASGGFAWFDGGNENEYITRHIISRLGHLKKLTRDTILEQKIDAVSKTGVAFLDRKFLEDHWLEIKKSDAKNQMIWHYANKGLHYLYARSFYLKEYPLSDSLNKIIPAYLKIAKENWLQYPIYEKGLAALTLSRFDERETAQKILESLKETASNNEDWGMYWIQNKAGYYWNQAPIETQALLIEAFIEINKDYKAADAMKVWLLKNRQNKSWSSTKSTTEAIYALLMQGSDWLSVKDNTVFEIGDEKILSTKLSRNEKEAETGYIKLNWKTNEVKKEMATVTIRNKSSVPGYGGIYWQYFEDLEKIKANPENALNVSKTMYLKNITAKGNELLPVTSKTVLKIGDLVTVRLVVNAKEDMEYVHLKDMRASSFEPVDVLSKYVWNGTGYYRSTKDAATHFFFDNLKKGSYVIEYDVRVNNSGDFSNGITTIQSMYAPEFSSHTEGIRIKIEP